MTKQTTIVVTGALRVKTPITTLSSALLPAGYFKSHCCKHCGPRSDCSSAQSDQDPHCLPVQEDAADDINRRHFQMQFFLAS